MQRRQSSAVHLDVINQVGLTQENLPGGGGGGTHLKINFDGRPDQIYNHWWGVCQKILNSVCVGGGGGRYLRRFTIDLSPQLSLFHSD